MKKIDTSHQKIIFKTIRKKLQTDPEKYGEPLRGELTGYWKLKVTDYRVIYTIKAEAVLVKVIKVGARRDFEVYQEMIKRIPDILNF